MPIVWVSPYTATATTPSLWWPMETMATSTTTTAASIQYIRWSGEANVNYPVWRMVNAADEQTAMAAWSYLRNDIRREIHPPRTLVDHEQARRNRQAAEHRARELLMSFLDDAQRIEFVEHRRFTVLGRAARYRVNWGVVANIEVLPLEGADRPLRRLCVHPEDPSLPVPDVMLAQLLHLRSQENELVQRANVHPVLRDLRNPEYQAELAA